MIGVITGPEPMTLLVTATVRIRLSRDKELFPLPV
jgi:hypothetical protein